MSVPAAPSNLTASASGNRIYLRWTDNATNETGFDISRQTDGGIFEDTYSGAEVNATSSIDIDDTGHAYTYRVRAVNGAEISDWSNTATVYLSSIVGILQDTA